MTYKFEMSHLYPKRKVGVIKKRKRARVRKTVVRLTGEKLQALRAECWVRDDYRCVVCKKWVPLDGDLYERMHMAHLKSRGASGSDVLSNVVTKCYRCHIEVEHGPKWSKGKR